VKRRRRPQLAPQNLLLASDQARTMYEHVILGAMARRDLSSPRLGDDAEHTPAAPARTRCAAATATCGRPWSHTPARSGGRRWAGPASRWTPARARAGIRPVMPRATRATCSYTCNRQQHCSAWYPVSRADRISRHAYASPSVLIAPTAPDGLCPFREAAPRASRLATLRRLDIQPPHANTQAVRSRQAAGDRIGRNHDAIDNL